MNIEATATATHRAFVRYRRLSVWALLVVVPVALWVAMGDEWVAFYKKSHETIIDVPPGASFPFGGNDWRLESIEVSQTVPAGNGFGQPNSLPPNTSRVVVRIAVTPQDAAAVERLNRCTVWLSSSDGRRWLTTAGMRDAGSALPGSCSGSYRSHPEVGKPFRFEQGFVVPTTVAKYVEPLIMMANATSLGPRSPLLRLRRS
jgi:hypothetical protein